MFQTISLNSITEKWKTVLASSQAIQDFCIAKYGKAPKIYVSINRKKPPTEKDCPYIIIFPGIKNEGAYESEPSYSISVAWCVLNENENISGNLIEQIGSTESNEFGQIILETLAEVNPSFPLSTVNFDVNTEDFVPQFPGRMDITINIPAVMGAALVY